MSRNKPPAPLAISPLPRPTISLDEWENKAPLSDLALKSVNAVKNASEAIPIPLKFLAEEPASPIPGTPLARQLLHLQTGSRPATPILTGSAKTTRALHPKQAIQTPQQFYDWFALIDRSVAHSQEAHHRAHVATVSDYLETCDLLLARLEDVDREVDSMLDGWKSVEDGGKNLKDACERLLEERDTLLAHTEEIGGHLEYFQELEHATRMLNHPGESLIFQEDFLYMVERVDICLDFLKGRRHYREAEVYLLRFQQCMTRAMTLIKMNFVGSLRALSSEIYKRLTDNEVSSTAHSHLLYTRFKSVATRISPLLRELEKRCQVYPDELSALLAECRTAYFSTRKTLLVPRIVEEIKGLDPARSELVELTRSGCSYLKQLCTDEFHLYREFFNSAEDQLYQYLETLCDLLYDDLRPRILHEPRLTVLCEVCTVLQALVVLDASSLSTPSTSTFSLGDSEASDDDDDKTTTTNDDQLTIGLPRENGPGQSKKMGRQLHTSYLLNMVLQDAQTRLFFKAQSVIQSEIRHFSPKPDDLAYPDILVAHRKPVSGNEIREKESYTQIFRLPSIDKQDTWYPTLKTMVWVLGQLHDFVKPSIFEDIAQEALTFCRQSLLSATEMMKTKHTSTNVLDAALFLTRHMVILKEVFNSLEADIRQQREDDAGSSSLRFAGTSKIGEFGGVTDTLTTLLSKTTSLLPESLFASLGVSRGVETDMRGIKLDIDQNLRKACEDVIFACSSPICEPLISWSTRANGHKGPSASSAQVQPSAQFERAPSSVSGSGLSTATPPGASSATLAAEVPNVQIRALEGINRDLRSAVGRVRLFLEDERTVGVLLDHAQDRVVDAFAEFRDAVSGLDGDVAVMSGPELRELLRSICREDDR